MPGNPVKKRPQSDLVNQIPSDWSPELQKAYDKALKDYKAQMPAGDILDYVRTPFNVMSNSMAGLGAEMLGKGKQFEAKYGWMPKTQAEMDAVEAMMRVMGPVIDTMDYLKVPPIVGPNTPTIAAAMQGVDRAAARLTAEQTAKAAANAGQAVKKAATSDDMAYAIENLLNKTGHGPMEIMMGPTSKTWRKADADLAVKMEGEGRSANDIWRKTGTFRAPDGKLRQEVPDIDMRYTSGEVEKKQYTSAKKRHEQAKARATTPEELNDANEHWNKTRTDAIFNLSGKTQDFVNHPELFAAYPELAKYAFKQLEPTHSQFTAPETVNGFYSPTNKRVTINTDAPYKRSTALHELQHAIQEIEGWQGGSNPEYITAKMAERDIAKKEAKEIQDRIDNMKATDPVLYEDLIRNEEGALGQRQYLLNQTSPLEGVTDPYEAYKKMSGEEEARMVQARRDYDERQRQDSLPIWNYETSPSEQITKDFAAGGEVHMSEGGFLGMLAKAAKQGVSRTQRLAMTNKDVAKRIPALEEAIAALERGEITKQQYAQLVQAYKPVAPYETFFKPESDEKIIDALTKTNREKEGTRPKQSYFGVPSSTLKRGDKAATRQDIPAYTHADTWVVTAHEPQQGRSVYAGAGPRIGYEPMAMLNDVKFQVRPDGAMKIAKGGQKGTIATMEGYWEPITRELAEEMGPELMRDPRWVQAGMDPTRSASFYDRKTMQPILEGEQVLHSGPLVLVKNPLYGDIEDFPFKDGGEVRAAKGGLLGALAKTAERGLERAAKAVPVAQRAIVGAQEILPAAERQANLAKFLEESKVPKRAYHGTKSKQEIKSFDPSKIGSATDQGYLGSGFYFDDYPTANVYAGFIGLNPENSISGGSVYPVHLSIKNPVELKNRIEGRRQVDRELLAREFAGLPKSATADDLRAKFIEMGHDGVIFDNNGVKEYVAFEPTQIKSALGNRGTYDINDPDINKAKGGDVHMAGGGKTGILGALARTAERGIERALKAAPQDEALRLAQLRAALPPAQGGLGLPANNTPQQRATAMRRDTGAYHGSKQDITGAFKPGYDDNLAFVTKSPDFANQWIGKGKNQKRLGSASEKEIKEAEDIERKIKYDTMDYDSLNKLEGDEFHKEYDQRFGLTEEALKKELGIRSDKIHNTVYPLTVEANKTFNPETDMDAMLEFFEKNGVPQANRDLYAGGNYLIYETKPVVDYLKSKGYDSMRLRESTGDDYPTIAVFNPESVRSRFAAHDPWRRDAATAAAFGVAAPDLLAQEQEPDKELTIEEFLKRMKAK